MDPEEFLQKHDLEKSEKKELLDVDKVYYYPKKNINIQSVYSTQNRLILYPGDGIKYRYEIIEKLGNGAFADVYKCVDHKYNLDIALKVVKNLERFQKQALKEVKIYDKIRSSNINCENIIKIYKCFIFRDDIFLSFEYYGINLYSYYKKFDTKVEVYNFGRQIANGLSFLHHLHIIHMDLKPENILVKDRHLKIIDMGSSIFEKADMYWNYVQSRYYRSPEVLFERPVTTKVDLWSLGCILYELVKAKPLFPAKDSNDLVLYYIHVLGYPSKDFSWIYKYDRLFNKKKQLKNLKSYKGLVLQPHKFDWEGVPDDIKEIIVKLCLCWEPEQRLSAGILTEHPYFNSSSPSDSSDEVFLP